MMEAVCEGVKSGEGMGVGKTFGGEIGKRDEILERVTTMNSN
jgi:hypothetical protein